MNSSRVLAPPRDLDPQLRLQSQIAGLQNTMDISSRGTPTSRIALPFASGWANYGSTFAACTYYVDRGRVYLDGLALSSSTLTTIATMPVGFQPLAGRLVFTCNTSAGPVRVDIMVTGDITIQSAVSSGTWCSLSGVDYRLST